MNKILAIEDDESSFVIIKRALEPDHSVTGCKDLEEARKALAHEPEFNLILLDVLLPGGDGFEFFNEIKKTKRLQSVPIIFITSKTTIADQILAFSLGAEDYITKPVHPLLLQAKIKSKLQKYQQLTQEGDELTLGILKFCISKQKTFVCIDSTEHELDLTTLEFKLLLYFARKEDWIFSRDQLMTAIWGENVHILDRTIDTHICHLRSKLKGSPLSLEAVHGAGYRLTRTKDHH